MITTPHILGRRWYHLTWPSLTPLFSLKVERAWKSAHCTMKPISLWGGKLNFGICISSTSQNFWHISERFELIQYLDLINSLFICNWILKFVVLKIDYTYFMKSEHKIWRVDVTWVCLLLEVLIFMPTYFFLCEFWQLTSATWIQNCQNSRRKNQEFFNNRWTLVGFS